MVGMKGKAVQGKSGLTESWVRVLNWICQADEEVGKKERHSSQIQENVQNKGDIKQHGYIGNYSVWYG